MEAGETRVTSGPRQALTQAAASAQGAEQHGPLRCPAGLPPRCRPYRAPDDTAQASFRSGSGRQHRHAEHGPHVVHAWDSEARGLA